jgi:hypothetical protein
MSFKLAGGNHESFHAGGDSKFCFYVVTANTGRRVPSSASVSTRPNVVRARRHSQIEPSDVGPDLLGMKHGLRAWYDRPIPPADRKIGSDRKTDPPPNRLLDFVLIAEADPLAKPRQKSLPMVL